MKTLRLFSFILLGILGMILTGFILLRHLDGEKSKDDTRTVFIKKTDKGFQLIRNGSPFYIRGASGNSHLKELALFGGNTIRLYDTINIEHMLNLAQENNLAVIVDLNMPRYNRKYNSYLNEYTIRTLKQKIKVLVHKYKNHPALLMWSLGNELKYPVVLKGNSYIRVFNELIDIVHNEDPNHPVSTAIEGTARSIVTSIYLHSPKIDLISYNIFGNVKLFHSCRSQISFLFGSKPYYISEIGSDGAWESKMTSWNAPIEQTSTKKMEQIKTRCNIINGNNDKSCLGMLVFYWGNKHQVTYTWYSLFMENYKSEIIKELESLWKKSSTDPKLMGLNYMLVEGKGAASSLVFAPNELKFAEIKFNSDLTDSVMVKWEIYPEAWHSDTTRLVLNPKETVNTVMDFEKNRATFMTPSIEGPYRIFAYVYDKEGNFATTNTPFYVLNPK